MLDQPVYLGEAEISLVGATLTSSGCAGPALAIDDDPATAAVFGTPQNAPPPPGTCYPGGTVVLPVTGGLFPGNNGQPQSGETWDIVYCPTGQFVDFTDDDASSQQPNGASASYNAAANTLTVTMPTLAAMQAVNVGSQYGTWIALYDTQPGASHVAGAGRSAYFQFEPPLPATRFLRVDWGQDAFISRIRLAFSGPGAGSAGVDYESSLSLDAGHNSPGDISLSYIPVPADGNAHEVVFSPPVLGRGAVFYPDALLAGPSAQTVTLNELEVYQDITQGNPIMPNPTTNQARVGCSGAVITPRFYTSPTSYPFPQTAASVLRSIQGLNFTEAVKLARETGGETVHQINGYETDREVKCKVSVERHDYLALQNFLGGTLIVNPANSANGTQETQYHAPNYTDRAPYFSLVALSTNGDPNALFVLPKCKIDGSLTADLERDKTTVLDVDFVLFWDYNYTRQDGTIGGIYEQIFNNGGATALHS